MSKKELISIGLSFFALVASLVAIAISIKNDEILRVTGYEGSYDISQGFHAEVHLAFINSGEHSQVISDLWATFSVDCSVNVGARVSAGKFTPFEINQSKRIEVVEANFVGLTQLSSGSHKICLYAEVISSSGSRAEYELGQDIVEIDMDKKGNKKILPARNRWQSVNTIISESRYSL